LILFISAQVLYEPAYGLGLVAGGREIAG